MLERGAMHKKTGRAFLKKAVAGEVVETRLGGKVETTNKARAGDWLVRADTVDQERYLLPDEKFQKLYEQTTVSFADHPDAVEIHAEGFNAYVPRGRCLALKVDAELLDKHLPSGKFIAAWGAPMLVEEGDYLAAPAPPDASGPPDAVTEVYRIEAKAFAQTYKRESRKNFIFLVRHGESRWNEAQNNCNVCGMLGEYDHGLSDEGREQARRLRKSAGAMKVDLDNCQVPAWKRPWLQRFLSPDIVICSPFTRAMQTAIIATEDITKETGLLKVMWLPREVKTSTMSNDTTGSKKGEELREHLRKELDELYQQSAWDDWLGPALKRMDFTDVNKEWWSEHPDTQEEIKERIDQLMDALVANKSGSTTILVGHSNFFRALFRQLLGEGVQQDIADSVRTHMLPHCAPIGIEVEDDGLQKRIVAVVPLLDEPKLAAASMPRHLFVPPTRCCLPQAKENPEAAGEWVNGERAPVQRRTCILNACNGSRIVT